MPLQSRVYLPEPVNLTHPLAQGLVSWWLCAPGLDGGSKWYDLVGTNNGTLTSMTTAASGWRSTTRPGGQGHLLFDGSGHRVDVAGSAFTFATNSFTVALWLNYTSGIYGLGAYNGSRWMLALGTTGRMCWAFYGAGGSRDPYPGGFGGGDLRGGWHHVACSFVRATIGTGLDMNLYVDGAFAGTTGSATNTSIGPSGPLQIGTYNSQGSSLVGAMDDMRIWSRALAATEIVDLYYNSRFGYPGLLNQTKKTFFAGTIFNEAGSGGANPSGSAPYVGSQSFFPLPAGVIGNGSTTNSATYNPSVSPTGPLASGSAWATGGTFVGTNAIYNPVITPAGCWAGGSAICANVVNLVTSSGAWAAGLSNSSGTSFTPALTPIGVWAVGTTLNTEIFNDIVVASAGVLANSSAVANEVASPHATLAGVVTAGSGAVIASYQPIASLGGAWSAGSGLYAEIDSFVSSGGTYGSGVVSLQESCNPQVQSAGIWTTGAATGTARYTPMVLPFGVFGAGSATASEVDSPTVSPAGLWATGSTGTLGDIYNIAVAAAGVWLSGSAVVVDAAKPQSSGGSWIAGSAVVAATYSVTWSSSGLLSMGSSDVAGVYCVMPAGGGMMAGSYISRITFTNPTRLTYHRFRIGEIIYVPSAVGDFYTQQAIRGRFSINGLDSWETGLGWFHDQLVLSSDQHQSWVRKRSAKRGRI